MGFISAFRSLYFMVHDNWKGVRLNFTLLFSPIILITLTFNFLLLVTSFVFWHFPDSWYLPFVTGGEIQSIFDRVFLLFGIFLMFDNTINNRW